MRNLEIIRGKGQLGRREASQDNISGMITTGLAVSGGAALGTVYELKSVADAEALGLDADYDTTNTVLVYHHIKEFFTESPSATLFILIVAQTVTQTLMADLTQAGNAVKLLNHAAGKIRQLGIVRNPAAGYIPTLSGGLDGDVLTAIDKAQLLAAYYADELHQPLSVIIEGRSFNGTATAATDLRSEASPRVSVVIGADKAVSERNALQNGYAAVGAALGSLSRAKVHESIGWREKFNLQDSRTGRFVRPGLSSNLLLSSYSQTDLDTLYDKGFIFAEPQVGIEGVYWCSSHACDALSSDYSHIQYTRTMDKAARGITTALAPLVEGPLYVDEDTGLLTPGTVADLEARGRVPMTQMERDGEVSGTEVVVDPDQNVLTTGETEVQFAIVPVGTNRKLVAKLNYGNPLA